MMQQFQQMQQLQQMQQSSPVIPVNELLGMMRQMTGLEEKPKPQNDPFQSMAFAQADNSAVEQQEAQLWQPRNEEVTQKVKKKQQEDELATMLISNPLFKVMSQDFESLIEPLADEVLNPDSPFSQADAEEEIVSFILDKVKGLNMEDYSNV